MLLIVIEYHYEDKYLNYQDEIVLKVSFHELRMILEMNEQLNNHLQLRKKEKGLQIDLKVNKTYSLD
jgi:hypothetical protein